MARRCSFLIYRAAIPRQSTIATDEGYALMITSLPHAYELTMQPFLSGVELLSTAWLSKLRSANAA